MKSPDVPIQLENLLLELTLADESLQTVLQTAHLSALHSTYTAAIKRIRRFNKQTMRSTNNLLHTLRRQPAHTKR